MSASRAEMQSAGKVKNNKLPTLRDVAALAGVSIKTVSRVVNHQNEISEETRQRVQEVIDRLNYRPNILARSLTYQRSHTLGVVAWGTDHYGPSRIILGIVHEANELGYSLFLSLVSHPLDDQTPILDTLISRQVDGIIWAVPEVGNNRKWLRADQLGNLPPTVFLFMPQRPGILVVTIDNCDGAKQAVRHLIGQGKRKIGIITGPMAWWEAQERYNGWREALSEAGLPVCPSLEFRADDWTAASGERGMQALLAQMPDMDAVFASNDQIALGAMGVVHRLGWRIPQQLAVAGFDNTPEAAFFWPPLTTMYQQLVDVGSIAVKKLHEVIVSRETHSDFQTPASIELKPELIVRASSRV